MHRNGLGAISSAAARVASGITRSDLLPLAGMVIAVAIFFWPVLLGRAWLPARGGDLASFVYPMYRFAAGALSSGQVPHWNPYLYAGAPFIADNQSGIFYPFNLLLFLLYPEFSYQAIEGLVVWHILFAGVSMYFCLRWLRPDQPLGRAPALIGALAFMFSGLFITHIGNLNLNAVAAWLPLVFVGLHRAIEADTPRGRAGWITLGGLALGISTLAGHGQMTALLALFLVMYALYQTIVFRRFLAVPLLLALALIAIGVAAISLFPALESLDQTVRAEFGQDRSADFSLPWRGLIGLIAPGFYGRGVDGFWGDWLRVEYGYVGILSWLLAAVAIIVRPSRENLFFLFVGIISLLLALGSYAPFYPLVTGLLPLFPFQAPARFVLLLDFCVAVLAAVGFHYLLTKQFSPRFSRFLLISALIALLLGVLVLFWQAGLQSDAGLRRQLQMRQAILVFAGLAGVSWLLIAGRLSGRLSVGLFAILSVLLLTVDLVGLGRNVEVDSSDPTVGFAVDSPALEFLKSDAGIHRLDIATGAWQPSLPQMTNLYSLSGVYNPLALANYSVYLGSVGYRGSNLYNLLGVKYIVSDKDTPPGDTAYIIPVFDGDPLVNVYLNTRALPRVSLLYKAKVVTDHDTAFVATHDESFDPSETLVLEDGVPLDGEPGQSSLTITSYELNSASFDVSLDQPAYLLLTDIFHPSWRATVDGEAAPVLTANYAFRAIYLDPGDHSVSFQYDSSSWTWGLGITLATWLFAALSLYWIWPKHGKTAETVVE